MERAKTVLLLEDDTVLRRQLSRMLARLGFETTTAACVREFDAHASERPFDAVVVDISLPDGDGIEAWSRVRNRQGSARAVAITANDSDAARRRANEAGMAALLAKPVVLQTLVATIAPQSQAMLGVLVDAGRAPHAAAMG